MTVIIEVLDIAMLYFVQDPRGLGTYSFLTFAVIFVTGGIAGVSTANICTI